MVVSPIIQGVDMEVKRATAEGWLDRMVDERDTLVDAFGHSNMPSNVRLVVESIDYTIAELCELLSGVER